MAKQFDVKALRQKVLSKDDIIYTSHKVEEWDVELPIKTLTAPEIKKIREHKNDEIRMLILAVLYGCKTREGESVFEETDLAKFELEKALGPVLELGTKILEISGLGDKASNDAKKS